VRPNGWLIERAARRARPAGLLVAAVATVTALLAGCGQRGPLYLPDSQPRKKLAADPQRPHAQPATPASPG
jgi:predicted small lipoprotein YifL